MCCGCWERDGAHKIDNETVRAMVALLEDADPFGALHIVVDDNNLTDYDLDWCRKYGNSKDTPAHQIWTTNDEQLYQAMRSATMAERVSAMGVHDGCWQLLVRENVTQH